MSRIPFLASLTVLVVASTAPVSAQQASRAPVAPPRPMAAAAKPAAAPAAASGLTVREAKPGLLAKATVRADVAEQTALGGKAGSTVTSAMIEQRGKELVYVFSVRGSDKKTHDVTINAATGAEVGAAKAPEKKKKNH